MKKRCLIETFFNCFALYLIGRRVTVKAAKYFFSIKRGILVIPFCVLVKALLLLLREAEASSCAQVASREKFGKRSCRGKERNKGRMGIETNKSLVKAIGKKKANR